MDILKKNSLSKPTVLLNLGSRNNSILNKIKSKHMTSNTNLNMLNVIKNKHKSIKNINIHSKVNQKVNSISINRPKELINKDLIPNKLSRVFSYRKIDQCSNNTNLLSSNKNINKEKILSKYNEEDNKQDMPVNNNNVTNNITNNITNIFINNDVKNRNKKNQNIKKNLSEKNSSNKVNKNNLTCSVSIKKNSLTKRNSMKNLKNMSALNRNNYNLKKSINKTNEIKTINNLKYNSNFKHHFNLNNFNNNTITGKNIIRNLNISNNCLNNTINVNNVNNTMSNYSIRIKYNKKSNSKQSVKIINKNKLIINENLSGNENNNEQKNNIKICNTNTSQGLFKKINHNNNLNNNKDKKFSEKLKSSIKVIDEIAMNKKSLQCLKRNQTEKGILPKECNSYRPKNDKNYFNNQISKINSMYFNYQITDYNNANNLTTKNLLLIEQNPDKINDIHHKLKPSTISSINSLSKKIPNYLNNNESQILNKMNKNSKLNNNSKINNYLNINIQNNNKSKSKSKEKYKNTIMNFFRNKSKKNNSLPKKLNSTNKNFLNSKNILNSYFCTSRILSNNNMNISNSKNNTNSINSVKKLDEYIYKPKNKNKSNNILINNISLNSINPIKKCFYYVTNNINTSNNIKNLNYINFNNNLIYGPFQKSKKYTFNYSSKEKILNNENAKQKEYYNNQTKIYNKKIHKNKNKNRIQNNNINSGFNLNDKRRGKRYNSKKQNSLNKIKNSKSPTLKKTESKKIKIIKESIENSKSYNKNNSLKKAKISLNNKKSSNKNTINNHGNKNKITVNQIFHIFKNQAKYNLLSNESIVKSERISPFKNDIIITKNPKSGNNNKKNLSKNKDKNTERKSYITENKITIKSNTKSQEAKSDEEEKIKIHKSSKNKSKTSHIINNIKIKKNDKDNNKNYFEIDISNSKSKSKSKSKSNSYKKRNTSSEQLNELQISNIEIKSENKNICSIDSIKSLKPKYKHKNSEDKKESSKKREKDKNKINNIDIPIELKKKDPQYLNEYTEDILESLLMEENYFLKKKYINPHYLENADSELTPEMRTVAVDWLVLIHHKIFKFKENTFFLAIQLFDRYLSKLILSVEKTELLLLTSFTLASKHEEVEYVNMQETLQLAQNKFTKEEIINMEYEILNQINFEILAPTMCEYFKVFALMLNLKNTKIFQGFYILNIVLVDFHMLKYPNCILALAVIKLINEKIDDDLMELVKRIVKEKKLEQIEGFLNNNKINSICKKIKLLYETFLETKYKNIQEKFSEAQYNCVSANTSI